jgi:hypothetical protein
VANERIGRAGGKKTYGGKADRVPATIVARILIAVNREIRVNED